MVISKFYQLHQKGNSKFAVINGFFYLVLVILLLLLN